MLIATLEALLSTAGHAMQLLCFCFVGYLDRSSLVACSKRCAFTLVGGRWGDLDASPDTDMAPHPPLKNPPVTTPQRLVRLVLLVPLVWHALS